MDLTLMTTAPEAALLGEACAVYAAAFRQAPYHEDEHQAAGFAERVRRYAAERDGFRLALARDGDGPLAGVALAVLARPGDWWRDTAAAALSAQDARRWLGDLCLEVVHVAVRPDVQRQGVGTLLHDALISGAPAPTGVLSCHPDARAAQRLYLGRDWTLLTEAFRTAEGQPGYWLMARDL